MKTYKNFDEFWNDYSSENKLKVSLRAANSTIKTLCDEVKRITEPIKNLE